MRIRMLADLNNISSIVSYLWHQTHSCSQVNCSPGGLSPVELISPIITLINEGLMKAFYTGLQVISCRHRCLLCSQLLHTV